MNINLKELTIEKAHADMKGGVYTPTDLANAYLSVIAEKNADINAYVEVYPDVLDQAKRAEEMFANGTATMMTGIPVALKDNMLRDGYVASAASTILKNYKSTYDSFVVKQLKDAGAVFLGRANMDDAAMGSSTETSAYGPTKNPLNTDYVPGGSSGGSVSAVAMDGALVALGSDTGGSIRQPASFTNLVGFKPTYGAVSRSGIIAMASSLDQVGPIAKTVADAEILFNAINAHDPMDGTSAPKELLSTIDNSPIKKKIGIPREFLKGDGIDADVLKNFEESCEKLKNAGYELVDVSLPLIKYSLSVYYIVQPAEVSSNLGRYDGMRYGLNVEAGKLFDVYAKSRGQGFGKEVLRRIILGTYILSHGYYDAYYNTAVKVREGIKKELANVFKDVDVIITPTTPTPPFKFGAKSKDPLSMYMSDLFCVPANIAGIPAISIPSGLSDDGMPLGFQMMAPHFREDILFTIGKDFEREVLSR
ncbi:MAG: Asp-tRNA(Asn)/Glu-tRNA(Gln) amidotransferase subunit GatA [Candidatus Pacebacteria bacterium]|nr:Asp-tRNA(Asn)/Glu-tRNA(Gln) amidotransferase subunit GatA [Candidatus Paceibacterota bacterium]MBP9715911.1 Asp-tRNA(Asn)/Glu-tRNA(Gln) amidotransferase subunit GatA [Candidatus Paceibacterota bacterium]